MSIKIWLMLLKEKWDFRNCKRNCNNCLNKIKCNPRKTRTSPPCTGYEQNSKGE